MPFLKEIVIYNINVQTLFTYDIKKRIIYKSMNHEKRIPSIHHILATNSIVKRMPRSDKNNLDISPSYR